MSNRYRNYGRLPGWLFFLVGVCAIFIVAKAMGAEPLPGQEKRSDVPAALQNYVREICRSINDPKYELWLVWPSVVDNGHAHQLHVTCAEMLVTEAAK